MPRLDGLSATTQIRQFDAMTPIISMTSNTTANDVMTYFANGMNDILPKPFSKASLLSMLEKHCQPLRYLKLGSNLLEVTSNGSSSVSGVSGGSQEGRLMLPHRPHGDGSNANVLSGFTLAGLHGHADGLHMIHNSKANGGNNAGLVGQQDSLGLGLQIGLGGMLILNGVDASLNGGMDDHSSASSGSKPGTSAAGDGSGDMSFSQQHLSTAAGMKHTLSLDGSEADNGTSSGFNSMSSMNYGNLMEDEGSLSPDHSSSQQMNGVVPNLSQQQQQQAHLVTPSNSHPQSIHSHMHPAAGMNGNLPTSPSSGGSHTTISTSMPPTSGAFGSMMGANNEILYSSAPNNGAMMTPFPTGLENPAAFAPQAHPQHHGHPQPHPQSQQPHHHHHHHAAQGPMLTHHHGHPQQHLQHPQMHPQQQPMLQPQGSITLLSIRGDVGMFGLMQRGHDGMGGGLGMTMGAMDGMDVQAGGRRKRPKIEEVIE
ncbi:kinase-regulated stress-responsive transcription factor skn7 [Lunasporangiospora selenospora]|uniref:Kinase-regulated stress-responsive transcription factor skn7 n=1 Tax=Lunasporangiospora selenospora TaxID=979761 RepID=A0A9P6K989_9FUNG|nr:kinase-regulated stress-responsive transcription factor skn7 [Lunasporangiospora selenospora]